MTKTKATVTIDDFGNITVYPYEPKGYVGPSLSFAVHRKYNMEKVREDGVAINMIHPHHGEKVRIEIPANPNLSIKTGSAGSTNRIEFIGTVIESDARP